MKISKYNHVFNHPTDDQKKVMCNYRTTALAIINPPQYEQYKLLCEDCNLQLENQLKKQLLEGGFILEDNIDEQTIMEVDMLRWRYATANLTLTLAPTMNCNFRCIYCYEKDSIRDSMMQPDIQQAILDFIKSKAPTISGLNITWYGGEPLLAWEIIKELTHKMQQICKDNQINYSASMVTNGYLMTEDMAKELESLSIKSIQITLDGPKMIHDQRRILVNGKGTFDRIIENINNPNLFFKPLVNTVFSRGF